jgi:hypothetical protein
MNAHTLQTTPHIKQQLQPRFRTCGLLNHTWNPAFWSAYNFSSLSPGGANVHTALEPLSAPALLCGRPKELSAEDWGIAFAFEVKGSEKNGGGTHFERKLFTIIFDISGLGVGYEGAQSL